MDFTNNYGVFWPIYPRKKGLTCIEYAVKASLGASVFKGQKNLLHHPQGVHISLSTCKRE